MPESSCRYVTLCKLYNSKHVDRLSNDTALDLGVDGVDIKNTVST